MTMRIVFPTLFLAMAASVALGQGREGTVYLPPVENTEAEFDQLASDLTPAEKLQEILTAGNAELAQALEDHRKQRTFATKDRVMELVAQLSAKVIREIGTLKSNEDRIRDSLRYMIRKVERVQHNLGIRSEELQRLDAQAHQKAEALNTDLRRLAQKITEGPENEEKLRRTFRRRLLEAQRVSRQHRAYSAHLKLHTSFGEQVGRATTFFQNLESNLDMFLEGLQQQKELLVMRVQLLRDSADIEDWLRGEGNADNNVVALATKFSELQSMLQRFNVATDMVVQIDDFSDVLSTFPTFDPLITTNPDGGALTARQIEDMVIEHYAGGAP